MTVWSGGWLASRVCGKTEHPEYNKHSLHRDIAVLHLCTQITFTEGTVTKRNSPRQKSGLSRVIRVERRRLGAVGVRASF